MANRLRDFTLSDSIFIDTNIFVYHQAGHPDFGPDSRDFLDRVERGEVEAVTTNVVVNEVIYVAQIQRAANLLGISDRRRLHRQMAMDGTLATECWLAAEQFLNVLDVLEEGGLTILDVQKSHYREGCSSGKSFQIFVSDATHVVICQQLGVQHLASNDVDFDRVAFLTRWKPGA
ncbi:MAG: hypothetical protein AUJ92_07115 [Armatimonadetes bacterium CG2_30_59_28]|nr:type II toxin-antitoxin system VapC family toxin [Armatimonadota bacterium]OIO95942.1 MAG: hypothetical protein AUJ92_07115 [Armatimonadetes bacterium CG2_30_59_28]PJB63182.1 MAG: hypothetical protein CO095_17045 [Armatimonadetes bacterium CG_4_9_14_3_um_filter_58_7]